MVLVVCGKSLIELETYHRNIVSISTVRVANRNTDC